MRSLVTQPPVTGASQPLNPSNAYDPLGYGSDGSLTTVTSGSANTLGSFVTLGNAPANWRGFWLEIGRASTAAARYLLNIEINSVVVVTNFYVAPATGAPGRVWIPLQVASGHAIRVQCRSSVGAASVQVAVSGGRASSSLPPGFTTCTELVAADTANTRPPTTSIPLQSSLGSWTQLLSSTAANYGALLVSAGDNATPATAQQGTFMLGTGGSGSEVAVTYFSAPISTGTGVIVKAFALVEISIPSGTRLSGAALAATPGSDAIRFSLHGFS